MKNMCLTLVTVLLAVFVFTAVSADAPDTMLFDMPPHGAFDASFIAAPTLYLGTLEEMPPSTLPIGDFLLTTVTRSHIRRDFTVSMPVVAAKCEFQSDNPFDLYINGLRISESDNGSGWHVTGACDISKAIRAGTNRIAIRGYTADEPAYAVCALRGTVSLTFSDGSAQTVKTDSSFLNGTVCDFWAGTEPPGWEISDIPANYAGVPSYTVHPRLLRRSCYFRKTFTVVKPVKNAILYAAAKGMYVPYLNGTRLTDARFLPGSMTGITEYQTFDVTPVLQSGANTLGALTGNGFYNCSSWGTLEAKRNAVMMQLEIEYEDGTHGSIVTDSTWRVAASPLYDNDLQFGERYDARLAMDNWCSAALDDSTWMHAEKMNFGTLTFAPETYEPVRVTRVDRAKTIGSALGGKYVLYDFGTNEAGRVSLTLHDAKPGERIIIRYCEALVGDTPAVGAYGDVYFEADNKENAVSPCGGRNIDVYICRGGETETYTPEFAYTGFRYIYITGYSGTFDDTTVRRAVLHNDLTVTGDFITPDEDLAEIWDAVKRSFRSNLVGGATDCPTREKNFWNGDLQMFVSTACRYMDVNALFSRWTMYGKKLQYDVYGWEDEEYIVPLALYRYYGNTQILAEKYQTILSLMERRRSQLAPGALLPTDHSPYNDHGAWQNVPSEYYAAAFYCRMYRDSAEIARVLGKEKDAASFTKTFEECRAAFNEKYFDAASCDYAPHNQSAIVLALSFDLAPEEKRQMLADTLHKYAVQAEYHLTCGFTSMEYVLGLLCDYGYADDAFRILHSTDSPSLLHMIRSHGGGTTTEGWGGFSGADGGSSLNHFAIGGISRFFFEYLGGIKIREAGFKEIDMIPYFDEAVGACETPYESGYGQISSAWRYEEIPHLFTWTVTVPEGVTAYCRVPQGFAFFDGTRILPPDTAYAVTGGVYTYSVCRVPGISLRGKTVSVTDIPHGADAVIASFDPNGRLLGVRMSSCDFSFETVPPPQTAYVRVFFLAPGTYSVLCESNTLPYSL